MPKRIDSLNRRRYLHACTYLFSLGKFTLCRRSNGLAGQICVLFVAVFWDREIYTRLKTRVPRYEKNVKYRTMDCSYRIIDGPLLSHVMNENYWKVPRVIEIEEAMVRRRIVMFVYCTIRFQVNATRPRGELEKSSYSPKECGYEKTGRSQINDFFIVRVRPVSSE